MTGILAAIAAKHGTSTTVSIPDFNPTQVVTGSTATATLTLTSAGGYTSTNDSSGNWVTPTSGASGYDVRMTFLSGNAITGTTGTWLNMASNQSWSISANPGNAKTATCTIEIRTATTGPVLQTKTVNFYAESF